MHTHLIGCRSNMGGCFSANSMAVIPTAQMSHCWLYPPFLSTAATFRETQHVQWCHGLLDNAKLPRMPTNMYVYMYMFY